MPIVNPDKVNIALPEEANDMIIYADTVSFTLSAGAAGTETAFTLNTNIPQAGLPFGIYTFDGGTTYNDLGRLIPNRFGSIGTFGFGSYAPTVTVEARAQSDGIITFNMRREFVLGSPVVVTISIALFNPRSIPATLETSTSPTLPAVVAYSSTGYYRKLDTGIDSSYTASSPVTVPHSAGKVPMVEFWQAELGVSPYYYYKATPYNDYTSATSDGIKVDASNIIIGVSIPADIIEPRVYKET